MNTVAIPTLDETVARMKSEIVAESRIPDDARDFSHLHDFIDANELGGFCEDRMFDALWKHFGGKPEGDMPDGMVDFTNAAQSAVGEWIKAGGLKQARSAERVIRITWNEGVARHPSGVSVIRCSQAHLADVIDLCEIALPDNDNGAYEVLPLGATA